MHFCTASISAALVLSAMSAMALPAIPGSIIEKVEGLPHSGTHGMGAPQGVPPKAPRSGPTDAAPVKLETVPGTVLETVGSAGAPHQNTPRGFSGPTEGKPVPVHPDSIALGVANMVIEKHPESVPGKVVNTVKGKATGATAGKTPKVPRQEPTKELPVDPKSVPGTIVNTVTGTAAGKGPHTPGNPVQPQTIPGTVVGAATGAAGDKTSMAPQPRGVTKPLPVHPDEVAYHKAQEQNPSGKAAMAQNKAYHAHDTAEAKEPTPDAKIH
ncbi:hypothetical protein FRB99_001871 [Tulasnella sp. 403]|nr:hypothetical protein FRB99_001871 [Tulasnella sp. 403]